MPGCGPKYYKCVLCEKRTKPGAGNRRHVNKNVRKFLRKHFMIDSNIGDVICGKCHRQHYEKHTPGKTVCPKTPSRTHEPNTDSKTTKSPPSINLPIKSAPRSHSYCCICKRPGPKLVVVSSSIRFRLFLDRNILLPDGCRCCPVHISEDYFVTEALNCLKATSYINVNRSTILDLIEKLRTTAVRQKRTGIDFDTPDAFSDNDFFNLTGLHKNEFDDLCTHTEIFIRNTPSRSVRTSTGIFLFKLKTGLPNKLMATIFTISKSSLRRAIASVRRALMISFVPQNLGLGHISRDEVIRKHTRPLAQTLFGSIIESPAIIVLDGTYIYIQKSENFRFQRRTYSMHKGRPLVKPMVMVTTSGYFITILGPYFADTKNNDASILNHMLKKNVENIRDWVKEDDLFIVDRGFRDSLNLLDELGIKAGMPSFLKNGEKQMTTEDANSTRLVTKIRWVVESANARIKKWRYLANVLPTNQVPFIGDYTRIVCALSNKYAPPLSSGNLDEDETLGLKMKYLATQVNSLKTYVEENALDKRSAQWETADSLNDFPKLDEEELRCITCGVYQLKLSPSYIQEYIDGECDMFIHKDDPTLLRVKIQSRHVSSKKYLLWIRYTQENVTAWYCRCRAGARVVGTCSHVAAVLWYLGLARYSELDSYGVRDWGEYLQDAAVIDESDSDESIIEE